MAQTARFTRKGNKRTDAVGESSVKTPRGQFECQWCKKVYSSERIMTNHMCEQRRRFQQKDTPHGRYGFKAFLAINESFRGRDHGKTEEDFRRSDYYLACMRWSRFILDVKCGNPMGYAEWLLKLKVKIDDWCKDAVYESWTQSWVIVEDAWDAIDRSVKNIVSWADDNSKECGEYFRCAGGARVLSDVQRGAVTGWVVFCSGSGREWMNSLATGDLDLVWYWLDVSRWAIKLKNDEETTNQIMEICQRLGL